MRLEENLLVFPKLMMALIEVEEEANEELLVDLLVVETLLGSSQGYLCWEYHLTIQALMES